MDLWTHVQSFDRNSTSKVGSPLIVLRRLQKFIVYYLVSFFGLAYDATICRCQEINELYYITKGVLVAVLALFCDYVDLYDVLKHLLNGTNGMLHGYLLYCHALKVYRKTFELSFNCIDLFTALALGRSVVQWPALSLSSFRQDNVSLP